MDKYTEKQLIGIARECSEFEHLINAVNYGSSWLNMSPDNCRRRCPECTHWQHAWCEIFQREIANWQ